MDGSHGDLGDDGILPGVKKAYRPNWLDDANKIFINKLNEICANYPQVFADVCYYNIFIFLVLFINIFNDRLNT